MSPRSLAFSIARRYFAQRKRFHAVQVVSAISSVAVGVVVMAVVAILSIYNGYEEVLLTSVSHLDAPLKVERADKVPFDAQESRIARLRSLPEIAASSLLIEGEGIVRSSSVYAAAHLLGLEPAYARSLALDSLMLEGSLSALPCEYTLGGDLYQTLFSFGQTSSFMRTVSLYVPKRRGYINPLLPQTAFRTTQGKAPSVLSAKEEKYDRTLFLSVEELGSLLDLPKGYVHALALFPVEGVSPKTLKESLQKELGAEWRVLDRRDQQPHLLKLVAIEKWMTFFILFFVLLLAAFNVICSSSMLIIEKRHDVEIYAALGARPQLIRSIFLWQGLLVTLVGALGGFLLGMLLVWLQAQFGWLTFGEGVYRQPYPVAVRWLDLLALAATIALVGYLSAFYPVRRLLRSPQPH